jgi:GNAT superfamily N-acetyltransferase
LIVEELSLSRLEEFLEIVAKMVTEAEFSYAKIEKHKILHLYKNNDVMVILAIDDDKIVGFIAAMVHEYFFSNRKRVSDLGFYVLPEHRGSRAAIKLVKSLETWAKQTGADDLHLGQTTAVEIDKTRQFYERLGYKTVGFNTIKHLKD